MKTQKGFIQILLLIAIIAGVLILGGAGYFGVRQYQRYQTQKIEQERITELEKKLIDARGEELESIKKEIAALKKQGATQALSQKSLSNSEIIAKVKPTVVYIETSKKSGSGMIIESDGYVLTNAHVVEGVNSATVHLSDKRSFSGSVVGRDEKIDLAVLKINGTNFSIVEFGNSDESFLLQGAEVLSAGYSYGFEDQISFKNGIVSRRLTDEDGITYLEITAEIQPGNSGGPLVNKFGQVVGVTTFIYGKSSDPLKFALPINMAKDLIPDLKNGRNIVVEHKQPEPTPQKPTLDNTVPIIKTLKLTKDDPAPRNIYFNIATDEPSTISIYYYYILLGSSYRYSETTVFSKSPNFISKISIPNPLMGATVGNAYLYYCITATDRNFNTTKPVCDSVMVDSILLDS